VRGETGPGEIIIRDPGATSGGFKVRETANAAKTTADAALPKSGGTMTGALCLGGNLLLGYADGGSRFANAAGVSIEMQTNVAVAGGVNTGHTGIRLVAGGMNGWGTAKLYKQVSSDHGAYGPLKRMLDEDDIFSQALSYVGNGEASKTLIFNGAVRFVMIIGDCGIGSNNTEYTAVFVYPSAKYKCSEDAKGGSVAWNGNSLTWSMDNSPTSAMNATGKTYYAYALGGTA
jgi:hypothetical protein